MTHPTDDQLVAYVLDPDGLATLAPHFATCGVCRERLQREAELELELAAVAAGCLECGRPVDGDQCGHCGATRRLAGYKLDAIQVHHARGRLYRARDLDGRRVAIKELVFAHAPGLDAVLAFEREAKFLRALDHPAIPRFVASFTVGEGVRTRMYLVQDWVDGESLLDRLAHHQFSEAELIRIAREVLAILVYLQAMTPMVFHRDVKPANLIARDDGSIALVDFGAARDLGATIGATVVGTFGYMPIEQLVGTVDATSDPYGLGMSLLHLATRTEPWQLDDKARARAHLSRKFRGFLDRLTAKEVARRYPSAAAALRGLDRPDRPLRAMLPAAAIATVLGATGGFAAWKLVIHRDAPPAPSPLETIVRPPLTIPGPPPRHLPRPVATPEPAAPAPALTPEERLGLDREIARLRDHDPAPERVRAIEVGIGATSWESDGHVDAEIVATRSPAAVPIVLRHAATSNYAGRTTGELATLFTLLTGHAVTGNRLDQAAAIDLVRTWWPQAKDALVTDPCKLDREARRTIERLLVQRRWVAQDRRVPSFRTVELEIGPTVDVPIGPGCREMVPELLSMADEAGTRGGVAALLATLRRHHLADDLQDVVRDRARSVSERFVALLAIANAGEPVMQDELLALFAVTHESALRIAMLHLMERCDPRVVPTVIGELEAPDEIRRAATETLRSLKPVTAVPALRKLLLATTSSNGMRDVTQLLQQIGTVAAIDALADNLDRLARLTPPPAWEDWGNTQTDFDLATRSLLPPPARPKQPRCNPYDHATGCDDVRTRTDPTELARVAKEKVAAWRALRAHH